MPRKIFDIDVEEITLCASAANRKQFFIKKSKEKTVDKFIEVLKGFVVDEGDDEFTDEEIAKANALGKEPKATLENALNTLAEYKESMPPDLLAAEKILIREASFGHTISKEDLEKAGAKLSKSTIAQITKALEFLKGSPQAIAMLQTMLGQKVQKVDDAVIDGDKEVLSEETVAKLDELAEFKKLKKEADEKEAEKKQAENVQKLVAEELKKQGFEEVPEKKSLDKEDEVDDKDKKEDVKKADDKADKWPSLYVPGLSDLAGK